MRFSPHKPPRFQRHTDRFPLIPQRTLLLVLPALIMFLVPSLVVADVDLDSLLANSVGGPEAVSFLEKTRTIHLSGTVNLNGMEGIFDTYFLAPDRYYARTDFGAFSLVQAFDGERAWSQNHNGLVSELTGHERKDLLRSVYVESYSFLVDGRLPGSVEYLGDVFEQDTLFHRVAFYPYNDDTVFAYFDTDDGRLRRLLRRVDNLEGTTISGDYREISGLQVAHHARSFFDKAPMTTEYVVLSVEINEPADTTLFVINQSDQDNIRFDADKDTVRIPFYYSGGHIFVRVNVNGRHTCWFLLDSGASANILDATCVERLDLPVVGAMPALGIGGWEQFQLVKADSLSIASLVLVDQVAGAAELSGLGITPPSGASLGGILGHDFLSRLPVLVDYGDSSLAVFRRQTFVPPKNGTAVAFRLVMNVPVIEAELNGIKGDWLIDLGNSEGLVVLPEYASENRLEHELKGLRDSEGVYGGVGGAIEGRSGQAETFVIGDIRLSSPEVLLIESGSGIGQSIEVDGIIGRAVLERFALLFDYANQVLYMYNQVR